MERENRVLTVCANYFVRTRVHATYPSRDGGIFTVIWQRVSDGENSQTRHRYDARALRRSLASDPTAVASRAGSSSA